jgi:methyl-accepting chemotaxis protein
MRFWQDFSISTKIVAALSLVFVSALGLGLFALWQVAAINDMASDIRDNWLPSTVMLGNLTSEIKEFRIAEARIIISSVDKDSTAYTEDVALLQKTQAKVDKAFLDYQPFITPGTDDTRYMEAFTAAWRKLKASSIQLMDKATHNEIESMVRLYRTEDKTNFDAAIDATVADMNLTPVKAERQPTTVQQPTGRRAF